MIKKQTKLSEKILGLSWGKATARLNNMILFMLVQETGRDTCHRCGEKILVATDLSRDHIEDWKDHGPDHYWNVKNIAFSHKACNAAAGLSKGRSRIRRSTNHIHTFI